MPFVLALFADSWMADRLQLKNHAFCFCLAVGPPASKEHTNTGFDLKPVLTTRFYQTGPPLFCLRARLQPCHLRFICNAALAAEVSVRGTHMSF
jgi:hypothetical protein